MNLDNQILDQSLVTEDGAQHVKINLASAGQRIGNYIIDVIVFYVLIFLYGGILAVMDILDTLESGIGVLTIYIIPFLYYIVMEGVFGKTIGKFITGTKVVTADGQRPEFLTIIGRTLCRIIPFEAFSFLGSKAVGWHDSIPGTRVIRDR